VTPPSGSRALFARHAVRLGLRASSRNPELAFGKALIDLVGSLLSLLPVVLAALLLSGAVQAADLLALLRGLRALRWPLWGAALAVGALSFAASAAFWAGAVPLLAADAEMGARPPPGNFARLAGAGFARVAGASALGLLLGLLQAAAGATAIVAGALLFARRPGPGLAAGVALAVTLAILGGLVTDALSRLLVVRASVLGEGTGAAFAGAGRLLGGRLGTCLSITASFWLLELIAAGSASALGGSISASAALDARGQLLALAPRAALAIASAAVLAWLEVARQGAFGMLAANDAGLLDPPEPPEPPEPVPTVLERPREEERVIEALPAPEEQVIEALPVPEEPVVEALPAPEKDEPPHE
jgi:hypothetical protein